MLILAIVLGIIAAFVGIAVHDADHEVLGGVFGFIGGSVFFVAAIALCLTIKPCVETGTLDDRIAMYQEENSKIEQQIAEVVTQYQEYEKDIFTEVSPDSAMTLVALYPELKSDTLVSSQIEVYVKNNETIKSLKEQQINGRLYRWWVYFGK